MPNLKKHGTRFTNTYNKIGITTLNFIPKVEFKINWENVRTTLYELIQCHRRKWNPVK